jgi:hypothetical protein
MSHRVHALLSFALITGFLATVTPSFAQNTSYIEAERYGARARLAQLADKPKAAGAAFEKAYDILANPSYLLKAGNNYTAAQDWMSAARVYSNVLEGALTKKQNSEAKQGLERAKAEIGGDLARLAVYFEPSTATIEIDGKNIEYGNPATVWVRAGEHTISVTQSGYNPLLKTINMIKDEPFTLAVKLEVVPGGIGLLRIQSAVAGADVYINEEIKGKTPVGEFPLAAGVYDLKLIKNGYEVWNRTIPVEGNKPTEVDIEMVAISNAPTDDDAPVVAPAAEMAAAVQETPQPVEEEAPAVEEEEEREVITEISMNDDYDDSSSFDSEPVESVSSDDGGSSGMMSIIGYSLIGLGAAVAGGGAYFTIDGIAKQTELDGYSSFPAYEAQGWQEQDWYDQIYLPKYSELTPAIEDANLYSYILYGSGGGLLITGIILVILDGGDEDSVADSDDARAGTPTWTGVSVSPVSGGTVFGTGFRF